MDLDSRTTSPFHLYVPGEGDWPIGEHRHERAAKAYARRLYIGERLPKGARVQGDPKSIRLLHQLGLQLDHRQIDILLA